MPLPKKGMAWLDLNDILRNADEKTCENLIKQEKKTFNRPRILKRIYARLHRVQKVRELRELLK